MKINASCGRGTGMKERIGGKAKNEGRRKKYGEREEGEQKRRG